MWQAYAKQWGCLKKSGSRLSYLSFHLKDWKNMTSDNVNSKVWILSSLWVKENLVYISEHLPEKV